MPHQLARPDDFSTGLLEYPPNSRHPTHGNRDAIRDSGRETDDYINMEEGLAGVFFFCEPVSAFRLQKDHRGQPHSQQLLDEESEIERNISMLCTLYQRALIEFGACLIDRNTEVCSENRCSYAGKNCHFVGWNCH